MLMNVTQNEAAITATLAKALRDLLSATSLTLDIKDDSKADKYTLARMNAREALRDAGF